MNYNTLIGIILKQLPIKKKNDQSVLRILRLLIDDTPLTADSILS